MLVVAAPLGSFGVAATSVSEPSVEWTAALADGDVATTPTADSVFAVSADVVYSVDRSDGDIAWRYDFQDSFLNLQNPPIVGNETVYVWTEGINDNIYAFDRATGTLEWEKELGDISHKPTTRDGALVVDVSHALSKDELRSFDAADGSLNWEYAVGSVVYPDVLRQ